MNPGTDTRVETVVLPSESTTRLKLKAQKDDDGKEVRWAEEVEDNEFKPMRTSKKCCIFHRKRRFDESDSDESSDEEEHDEHCHHHHSHQQK